MDNRFRGVADAGRDEDGFFHTFIDAEGRTYTGRGATARDSLQAAELLFELETPDQE